MKDLFLKAVPYIPTPNSFFEPFFYIYGKFQKTLYFDDFSDNEELFTNYYLNNRWGSSESVSGTGSTINYTKNIREEIEDLLKKYEIKSILDAPCGDYNWFRLIKRDKKVSYLGCDIVKPLIKRNQNKYGNGRTNFRYLDITKDKLPGSDILICRDCLPHFSYSDISKTLSNFLKSDIKYLLTSTYPKTKSNRDISTGEVRLLNLELPPFNFPKANIYLNDWIKGYPVRKMGLWERDQLSDLDLY